MIEMEWNLALAVSDMTGIWVNLRPEHMHGPDDITNGLKMIHNFGNRMLKLFPGACINAHPEPDFDEWSKQLERADRGYAIIMGRHARRIVECIENTPILDNYHRYLVIKYGHYCRKPPQYPYPLKEFAVTNDPYYKLTMEFSFNTSFVISQYARNHTEFYGTIYTSLKSPGEEETKPWP